MNKTKILELVRQYEDEKFNKEKPFRPGIDRVPVSGAVIFPNDIVSVVDTALDSWFTEWKVANRFTKELEKWLGVNHAILTNSGSSATLIALSALKEYYKIPNGAKVVTSPLEFPTTISAIIKVGLVPLFVDINIATLSVNTDDCIYILKYNKEVKGIVLSHVLGFPYRADIIREELSINSRQFFLEDICDAIGAKINGENVGTFGNVSTLSMFPAHHFTAGEGGACFTDVEQLKVLMDSYRSWGRACWCLPGQQNTCGKRFEHEWENLPKGWDHKYTFSRLGYNLKMTELQAALGLSQLSHLDDFIDKRRYNFYYLKKALKDIEQISTVFIPSWSEPSPFGFPIIVSQGNAQELIRFLQEKKIDTRPVFAGNITRHPMMKDVKYEIFNNLKDADFVMNNVFWIGCHPGLTEKHLDYVSECFHEFYKGK